MPVISIQPILLYYIYPLIQHPHSTECNPVEHIWEYIRENWFSNTVFKSLKAMGNTLVDSIVTLENNS